MTLTDAGTGAEPRGGPDHRRVNCVLEEPLDNFPCFTLYATLVTSPVLRTQF